MLPKSTERDYIHGHELRFFLFGYKVYGSFTNTKFRYKLFSSVTGAFRSPHLLQINDWLKYLLGYLALQIRLYMKQ